MKEVWPELGDLEDLVAKGKKKRFCPNAF